MFFCVLYSLSFSLSTPPLSLSLSLSPSSCFTSLCYTADGRCILAGGRSKFICIYDVTHQVLLKKFQISRNRAFDGMKVQCCIRGALTDTHTCTSITRLMCTISFLCVQSILGQFTQSLTWLSNVIIKQLWAAVYNNRGGMCSSDNDVQSVACIFETLWLITCTL